MTIENIADTTVQIEGGWLPGSRSPEYFPLEGNHVDRHQEEMADALARGESCVLNANPTGGGKTLSWAAPVIRRDLDDAPDLVMATYPTAALLEDQRETLLGHLRTYFGAAEHATSHELSFELRSQSSGMGQCLTDGDQSFALDELVQTVSTTYDPSTPTDEQVDRAKAALVSLEAAGLPGICLTTPDTLTNLATNRFHNNDVDRLVPILDAIVVDEFHLATDRARRLLPFHLDHYRSLSSRFLDSFVFLSATPNPSYVERLDRVFDPVRVTDRVLSGADPDDSTRQILPESRLGVTTRRRFTNGEWLADNVDFLESLYEPPGQLLVIVDSVREVEQVTEAIGSETELSTGRVYGWKREGRQEVIKNSEVVVGNTAVEVGVDFQNVNRLVCTGYEPASLLQRIGRMRYRDHLDDYQILLITSPGIQTSIVSSGREGSITRPELDRAVHEPSKRTERPYYDVLCGAYSRYLWERAENHLSQKYVGREDQFRDIAADHFGPEVAEFLDASEDTDDYWTVVGQFLDSHVPVDILEELHWYRPSSLSCVVVDTQDEDEPLKTYSLAHVLRHREGKVVALNDVEDVYRNVHGKPLGSTERALLERSAPHAVAGFLSTGRRTSSRSYFLQDFTGFELLERQAKEDPARAIRTLPNPSIKTDPAIEGIDEIDLSDEDILAQYVRQDPMTARERYGLGPYAAVVPTPREGCLLLWDDAIKGHCELVGRVTEEE